MHDWGLYIWFQEDFVYFHEDYDKQLARLVNKKERSALIINDPKQSMFLFLDKHHIQVKIWIMVKLIFFSEDLPTRF